MGTRCELRYLMVMPLQLQALLGMLKHCCSADVSLIYFAPCHFSALGGFDLLSV